MVGPIDKIPLYIGGFQPISSSRPTLTEYDDKYIERMEKKLFPFLKEREIYPCVLGATQKNQLMKMGGRVKQGRWVNLNHMDWSNPKWAVVEECNGWVVDRSIGGKDYSLYQTDYAVMTYYMDPVLEMPVYDMLPINSPLFDVNQKPSNDLEELYSFVTVEGIPNIPARGIRPMFPLPMLGVALAALLLVPSAMGQKQ